MTDFIQYTIPEEDVGPQLQAAMDVEFEMVSDGESDENDESDERLDPLVIAHMGDVQGRDPKLITTLFMKTLKPDEEKRFAAVLIEAVRTGQYSYFRVYKKFFQTVMLRAGRAAFKMAVLERHQAEMAIHRENVRWNAKQLSDNELENADFEQGRAA